MPSLHMNGLAIGSLSCRLDFAVVVGYGQSGSNKNVRIRVLAHVRGTRNDGGISTTMQKGGDSQISSGETEDATGRASAGLQATSPYRGAATQLLTAAYPPGGLRTTQGVLVGAMRVTHRGFPEAPARPPRSTSGPRTPRAPVPIPRPRQNSGEAGIGRQGVVYSGQRGTNANNICKP